MKHNKYKLLCIYSACLIGFGGLTSAFLTGCGTSAPAAVESDISSPNEAADDTVEADNMAETDSMTADSQPPIPSDTNTADSISENTTASPSDLTDNPVTVTTEPETNNPKEAPMEDRITYEPGFYYESLSDTVKQRIDGISYHENPDISYEELRYVSVKYIDFDGNAKTGELICNEAIAPDLTRIFFQLYEAEYPIEKMKLIDEYNGDDEASMADNNSSCFNYRPIAGTGTLSKHALGLAVDINPLYNPYVTYADGSAHISPENAEAYADRTADFPHKITSDDFACQQFKAHGFTWGGDWNSAKDYQHFQKAM